MKITLIRGVLLGWYPYPVNVGNIGYLWTVINMAVLTAIGIGLGVGILALDKVLPKDRPRARQVSADLPATGAGERTSQPEGQS